MLSLPASQNIQISFSISTQEKRKKKKEPRHGKKLWACQTVPNWIELGDRGSESRYLFWISKYSPLLPISQHSFPLKCQKASKHFSSNVSWFVWAFTITWMQACLLNILCTACQYLPSLPNKRIDSVQFASLMLCVTHDIDVVFSCFRPRRETSFFPSSIYPLMLEVWSPRL